MEPKPSSSGSLGSSKIGQKKIPMTYTEKKVRARQNEVSSLLKKHDDGALFHAAIRSSKVKDVPYVMRLVKRKPGMATKINLVSFKTSI